MAIYRSVQMSFWTDTKVVDEFTPEDKYFYLYLFTNPHTNLCGCYEISITQMSTELGYSKDTIGRLIERFEKIHKVALYQASTKEILLINWHKYNWNVSPKLDKPLYSNIEKIKCNEFHDYLASVYNQRATIEENIPYRYGIEKKEYPMDTTITNTIPITNSISNNNSITNNKDDEINEICSNVINRLNELTGSNFRSNTKNTVGLIKGRLNEGFTEKDLIMVVEKMCYLWSNPKKGEKDMREYLQPSTLFRPTNFENYYNKPVKILTTNDVPIDISDF